MIYVFAALAAVIIVMTAASFKKVPPETVFVVERMGSFYASYGEGVHFVVPLLDKVTAKISLAPQCLPLEKAAAVSADQVSLRLSALIRFSVTDAQKYSCSTENTPAALSSLTLTAFRNVISAVSAGDAVKSQDTIEKTVFRAVSAAAEQWGLNVSEIKLTELSLN